MANVNLAPMGFNPYAADQRAIERQRLLAELMQEQSMQPIQSPTAQGPLGGVTAPISWTQGLAKMLQAYSGKKGQEAATEQEKALGQRYTSEGQAALAKGLGALQGSSAQTIQPDPQEAQQSADLGTPQVAPVNIPAVAPDRMAAMQAFGSHPATAGMSQALMAQMLKADEPYSLAEGAKRMQGSRVVAENQKQQPGFSLMPGGVRFGPDGKPIAALPEKIDYNKPFLPDGRPNPAYQEYALKNSKAGAANQQVVIAQEKEFERELGKEQGKALVEGRKNADDAVQIINTVNIGKKILKDGMVSGFGANAIVTIGQALKQAGMDFGKDDPIANAQAYTANMAQNVGKIIKQFGSGTGLSDADREYATKMAGGLITLDRAAIEKILDINERAARNIIRLHNKRAKDVKTNIPLTVEEPPEGDGKWSVVK